MIQNSYEWKMTIKRNNAYILRMAAKCALEEDSPIFDRMQIRLTTNALLCRRLLETPKVASNLRNIELPVTVHPWNGKNIDFLNNHRIDEKYQWNNPLEKKLPAPFLCDQIIHSFVWAWVIDEVESQIVSFMVSSERKKHSELYIVDILIFCEYLKKVSCSWPAEFSAVRDTETLQWKFDAR